MQTNNRMWPSTRMNPPSRIAFGSCNDQSRQNNLWEIIQERNPVGFIWGGDAIYAGEIIVLIPLLLPSYTYETDCTA